MRLVCPNCDAQYEVDDAAIPEAGRDVQCSNCGHAWFQRHPEVVADEEFEDEIFLSDDEVPPPAPVVAAPPTPAVVPEPEPEPEEPAPVAAAEPMVEVVQDEDDGPEPPPAAMQDAPARKPALDESLMAVLREEAEREAAVRRVEEPQQRIETQTDLGLTSAPPTPPVPASVLAARERFADLSVDRVEADEDEGEIVTRPTSRRELLPDIEEINSTLRASSEPRGEGEHLPLPPVMVVDGRRGFRSGFTLMLLIAAGLWLAYVMAPRIATQIPASAAAMDAYVSAVNKARVSVDAALQSASKSIRSLSGQDG